MAAGRGARKRTPRKKGAGNDEGGLGEGANGGKGAGGAESAAAKGRKASNRPAATRESPNRQTGGEEDGRGGRASEPGPAPEKAERSDSKSKRTPRKRIVRNSTNSNPSSGTPTSSPAKTPTSTPSKQNGGGGASGGGSGTSGRKSSPTRGSASGEGRREVVKIHFPTAQERQAGGSPKLDASKFVDVEESPPTTPPAAANMRGTAEEPGPQAQQHPRADSDHAVTEATDHSQLRGQHEPNNSVAPSSRGPARSGRTRGPRAATMVTVGSHGTTMADVAVQPVQPVEASAPESRRPGPMGDDEHPDGQSPPRSLIRKLPPKVNTPPAAADGRATSPTPPGLTGWTPPSPHSRKSLGDAVLAGSGSEGEDDGANTTAAATPAGVQTFPARAPVPSSNVERSVDAGAADAANERDSADSTNGPENRSREASAGQPLLPQTAAPMLAGMYPEYGYGGGGGFAQYPPGGWYPSPGGMHMPQMSPQQAMAAAYGMYGMALPPQMQQMQHMQMPPQQGQQGQQQMGGQHMQPAFGAPPEWYAVQEVAGAGQWPMGGMPPVMPGMGQPWPIGPDGYPMVMPPQQQQQQHLSAEAALSQLNGELTRAQAVLQHQQSAPIADGFKESPEEMQAETDEESEPQQLGQQQAQQEHFAAPEPAPTPARRPAYVRPSDRGKPGFQQEQEHKLLAYAAGGDEQARALALKVARNEEQAAAQAAANPQDVVAPEEEVQTPTEAECTANGDKSSTKKRRAKRRNKKAGDGAPRPTNVHGGDPGSHGSNTVRGSGSGRNVSVSSAPTSSADDDIGGLEGRSRGNQVQNYDDDDIGGLEYSSTQRRLYGGPRQVRGAVYASDVEQASSGDGAGGKKQLGKQHGQKEYDGTSPQVAQLFAHAAATGAWGKP